MGYLPHTEAVSHHPLNLMNYYAAMYDQTETKLDII